MSHLTAAFMAIGLSAYKRFGEAHAHIDIGHIDMVDSCIRYAGFVDALGEAGFAAVGNYPGTFLYEVAEEAGSWYCAALLECKPGHYPEHETCTEAMRLLAYDFFKQGMDEGEAGDNRRAELARALAAVEFVEPV